MSDRELWDALTVLARRAGWIERGQRIVVEGDPREELVVNVRIESLCLAYGKYREVRLCCTEPRGHGHDFGQGHSWERGMVGKSACLATSDASGRECELPTHHAGEHKAHAADGVRWTWGDAPRPDKPLAERATELIDYATARLTTESPEIRCKARAQHESGAYFVCQLASGHDGEHRHQVAGGEAHTWPDVIREKYGTATRVIDPTEPRAS